MLIYLDNDYKCYVTGDDTLVAVETDLFNGKCAAYIEGYRFVPSGETWTRSDGAVFKGEMLTPWKPYAELVKAQAEYENERLKVRVSELEAELAATKILLGVE